MYGVVQFAKAAARLAGHRLRSAGHGVRRRAEPRPAGTDRRARPARAAPARAGPRRRGVRAAVRRDQRRRSSPAARRAVRSTTWPNWRTRTAGTGWSSPGCRKGPVPAALAARRPGGGLAELAHADRDVRARQRHGRADLPARPAGDDERNDTLPELGALAGVGVVASSNVHYAAPAQTPARPGAGRDPGPPQPGRDGRLAARGGHRLPAVRRGDGRAPAEVPRGARAHGRAGPGVRVRLHGDRPPAAGLPGPGRAHRGLLAARAGRPSGPRPLRAAGGRAGARRVRRRSPGSST